MILARYQQISGDSMSRHRETAHTQDFFVAAIMPTHPANLPAEELLKQCSSKRLRRSGPGGQHRNKVETAVVLTHTPTGVSAEANERRSQAQNHEQAVHRLRVRLALEIRTEQEEQSELWRKRSRGGKLQVNLAHADYPALLAEALDCLAAVDWDDRAAAGKLGVSRTQFIRFLQSEPLAMEQLNHYRSEQNLPPLK